MNKDEIAKKLSPIFKSYPEAGLVYLFGSQANGETGPLSDYDLAVYLDEKDRQKMFEIKLELMDKIGRALNTDKVDVVILNLAESPELKYNIIKEGKIIYEKEPFRVLVEPKILSEYFDFHDMIARYNLTQA